MISRIKLALAVLVVVAGLTASIGGSYALTLYSVQKSNNQWCAALNLLTAHPVPKPANPAANPSREQSYQFYSVMVDLKHRFGC